MNLKTPGVVTEAGLMARRFARLRPGASIPEEGVGVVPDDGMCLSVFLVLRSPEDPHKVLFGRVNPTAPWGEVGGLDPHRVARVGRSWMLPSRQLIFFEGPEEAAREVAREQLGSELPALSGPKVFSEVYRRPGSNGADPHWDIHFVFDGPWPTPNPPVSRMWDQLEFVDVRTVPGTEFARAQGDVLELVGLLPGSALPGDVSASERTRRQ